MTNEFQEAPGKSNEWYTPKYIFDGLGCRFDLDVASPEDRTHCHVPADLFISKNSLQEDWGDNFIWMNPPFDRSKEKLEWFGKFIEHGNGLALSPDRTCTEWWHLLSLNTDAVFFFEGRPSFINEFGEKGDGAKFNACLWGIGDKALDALYRIQDAGLGALYARISGNPEELYI